MSDRDWLRQKADAQKKAIAERLAEARAEAEKAGKEPFDFESLCAIYDVGSDLSTGVHDPEGAAAELERKYYLSFPDVKTLAEFAERMNEHRPYK